MRRIAVLLAALLALGCGEEKTAQGGDAGSGGSDAGPPLGPISWSALPTDGAPSARYQHTAVWTGEAMIIWGGRTAGMPQVTSTGAIYDPAAKTWTPTSTAGAPTPRFAHSAVWTGSKMIIWGGYGEMAPQNDGALYDPATDTWSPMTGSNKPEARISNSTVWTGKTMIVWGGRADATPLSSGGIYDPEKNSWTAITAAGAPSARYSPAAAWTGDRMIVWGGSDFFDWRKDGAIFDPAQGPAGTWTTETSIDSAPVGREGHSGVWDGARMVVWGGFSGGPYENTGGLFDPGGAPKGSWAATAMDEAPSPRSEHVGLWTGGDLIIVGGCGGDDCGTLYDDGGRFVPDADGGRWIPIAGQAALGVRRGHAGVVTGTSIFVWGGRVGFNELLNTGVESTL